MNDYAKQTQSCPPPADSKGAPMLHILITSEQVITAVLQSRLALRYILRNPDAESPAYKNLPLFCSSDLL